MNHISSVSGLLIENMNDLLSIDKMQIKALEKTRTEIKENGIKDWIEEQCEAKKTHLNTLQKAFQVLGISPSKKENISLSHIIKTGLRRARKAENHNISDEGLMHMLYKVKHFEVINYETACTYARQMGEMEVVTLLEKNMMEEKTAFEKLSKLALRHP